MKSFKKSSGLKEERKKLPADVEMAEWISDKTIDRHRVNKGWKENNSEFYDLYARRPDYKRQNGWKKQRRKERKFSQEIAYEF